MAQPLTEEIVVIGAKSHPVRDIYHSFMKMGWIQLVVAIGVTFLFVNVLFACLYALVGGVRGARAGSLHDAFFFSVQTMGTIGYGAMYPEGNGAEIVMTMQTVASVIFTALATGLVFARFSQPIATILFSNRVYFGPHDGIPTLNFRIGNDRSSTVFETQIRVVVFKTERLKEGSVFYRMHDLKLVRERAPALSRSWTVLHVIDASSPLFGMTPEKAIADELEIAVSVVGTDDTSLQPVQARHRYLASDIQWGARAADMLDERPDGTLVLDLRRFHDWLPTEPFEGFPYPEKPPAS